jgi:uncharacterized membrane protein YfcA
MLTADSNQSVMEREKEQRTGFLLIQGLLVGMLTGLLGIGGGFLIVPALYFWARLPMKTAIGTTLLIIAINSLFSFATSFSTLSLDWSLLLKFSAGSVLGILIGIKIVERGFGDYLKGYSVGLYCVFRFLSFTNNSYKSMIFGRFYP